MTEMYLPCGCYHAGHSIPCQTRSINSEFAGKFPGDTEKSLAVKAAKLAVLRLKERV
jgi:hypothetical protein